MLHSPKNKWIGITVLLAFLAGTHWWAYRLGAQVEHARTARFLEGWYDADQENALRDHVKVLTMMAKHSQGFDWEDIKSYCKRSLLLANQVEKSALIPARETGDDPKADRLQHQVDEARRLVALLSKGKG